jgi:Domain of unknown function (DUF222)
MLTGRLRISTTEAGRRLHEAADLGPRVALSGQPLAPALARVAAAQAGGRIGVEHVVVLRRFFDRLPSWVDATTRAQAEATLVDLAVGFGPTEVRMAAERLMALLDQDGPMPDAAERARKRHLRIGRQRPDGMSSLTGEIDAEARACLEPILGRFGAPGMCNPDDDHPRTSGTPSQTQIDGDHRSVGQRHHNALVAAARSVLSSGELGRHHGLPATIIVSTTLQELESEEGTALTAGGTVLSMRETIRLASHARHYLRVFDRHTREELYLGRSKRVAPPAHRIVLYARDRGCTFPGCTVPASGTQVHHSAGWKDGGRTDITEEVLACGPDNRMAEHGWQVIIRHGVAEWIPSAELDVGQHRINHYHHPDQLLAPPEDEPEG